MDRGGGLGREPEPAAAQPAAQPADRVGEPVADRVARRVAEIRDQVAPEAEGALWVLICRAGSGQPLLAMAVTDAVERLAPGELADLGRKLGQLQDVEVLLAVPRADAQPRLWDRRLWEQLDSVMRARSTPLLDLVVVGRRQHWSARTAATSVA
jgi:hypothetical protein